MPVRLCKLPTGVYYVIPNFNMDNITDIIVEIKEKISGRIADGLLKYTKSTEDIMNIRDKLIDIVYYAISYYEHVSGDSIINIEKDDKSGLVFVDRYNPINITDNNIKIISGYIKEELKINTGINIDKQKIIDAITIGFRSTSDIHNLLQRASIGIVEYKCYFGIIGFMNIIYDPYNDLKRLINK